MNSSNKDLRARPSPVNGLAISPEMGVRNVNFSSHSFDSGIVMQDYYPHSIMRVRRYLDYNTPKSSETERKASSTQRLHQYYYSEDPIHQPPAAPPPLYANYPAFQTPAKERRPVNPYAEEMSRMLHTIKIKNAELARQENLIMRLRAALEERNHALAQYQLSSKCMPTTGRMPTINRVKVDTRQLSQSRNKVKRVAISGESSRYLLPNKANVPQSFEKSPRTKDMIQCAILANDFMKHLDPRQISEIIESMCPVRYPTASFIIKEGEVGSVVYVLADGYVEVTKSGGRIREMSPGTVFGELAILYNCTRTATVKALTDCTLWAIDRATFQSIMMTAGLKKQEQHLKFLKSVPTFSKLRDEVLVKISDELSEVHYEAGEYIIREGATGDTFFVISRGKVKVTKCLENNEEKFIRYMEQGEFFGEKALKNEDVRTANIIAMEPGVECLVLDRNNYNLLIKNMANLERRYSDDNSAKIQRRKELFPETKISDLLVLTTIGVGGFGRVQLVHFKGNERHTFALKKLKKSVIVEMRQQEHVMNERDILMETESDFIIKLYRTYKDKRYLYFLMEVCLGGELWTILRNHVAFNDASTRFYTACVVQALDYLHRRGIIYRDLKPENLLLDERGFCKLTDFGFAKKIGFCRKTWTFCGTPEYVAPEIILNKGHDFSVDFWSLGILIFELLTGTPPFCSNDPMKTYNIILKGINAIEFPSSSITKNAQSLIKRLCRDNPSERLDGAKWISEVKKHVWFEGFNWNGLLRKTIQPPILPNLKSSQDVSNFDCYDADDDVPPEETSGWDADF